MHSFLLVHIHALHIAHPLHRLHDVRVRFHRAHHHIAPGLIGIAHFHGFVHHGFAHVWIFFAVGHRFLHHFGLHGFVVFRHDRTMFYLHRIPNFFHVGPVVHQGGDDFAAFACVGDIICRRFFALCERNHRRNGEKENCRLFQAIFI